MIVTIDGPAGSGKSTVSRLLAEQLNVRFLDTGAMYRAVALAVLRENVSESDSAAVAEVARGAAVRVTDSQVFLNEDDVTESIRTPEVTAVSSVVASHPEVRSRLVELQREFAANGPTVTEGRDQGSVVFPDAEHKFFLTAGLDSRATRRRNELATRGVHLDFETVRDQLRQRDERDETRNHAPMRPAADAVTIDTSDLSIAQVVDRIVYLIESPTARKAVSR